MGFLGRVGGRDRRRRRRHAPASRQEAVLDISSTAGGSARSGCTGTAGRTAGGGASPGPRRCGSSSTAPRTVHRGRDHETGEEVFHGEVTLGCGPRPDRDRQPQRAADQPGQVPGAGSSTFDSRSAARSSSRCSSTRSRWCSTPSRDAGIEAFLAYGTLLGAVREGKVIGNDSDADLGYVSHHTHPVDVIRESFRHAAPAGGARLPDHPLLRARLQGRRRRGRRRGPRPRRLRRLPDGRPPPPDGRDPRAVRGVLDPPARHHHPRGPHLPGAGRPGPAARRDVRRSWRVPDPAFHFAPPATTVRRLNGWFRGLRVGRAKWDRIYSRRQKPLAAEPSPFVAWAAGPRAAGGDVRRPRLRPRLRRAVDGRPRGAVASAWTSSRARTPTAAAPRRAGRGRSGAATCSSCATSCRPGRELARRPGPRLLTARHLVDTPRRRRPAAPVAAGPDGAGGRGRRAALPGVPGPVRRRRLRAGAARQAARGRGCSWRSSRRAGATIVHRETIRVSDSRTSSKVCRLVVEWRRGDG